jgi:hypothetical protein
LIIIIVNGLLKNNCRINGDGEKGGFQVEKGK